MIYNKQYTNIFFFNIAWRFFFLQTNLHVIFKTGISMHKSKKKNSGQGGGGCPRHIFGKNFTMCKKFEFSEEGCVPEPPTPTHTETPPYTHIPLDLRLHNLLRYSTIILIHVTTSWVHKYRVYHVTINNGPN